MKSYMGGKACRWLNGPKIKDLGGSTSHLHEHEEGGGARDIPKLAPGDDARGEEGRDGARSEAEGQADDGGGLCIVECACVWACGLRLCQREEEKRQGRQPSTKHVRNINPQHNNTKRACTCAVRRRLQYVPSWVQGAWGSFTSSPLHLHICVCFGSGDGRDGIDRWGE